MTDLKQLFLSERPLLDVRAPVEFDKGAFPSATNFPILDDAERHQVGICYEEQGPEAAEALGYELVGPHRDERVAEWQGFLAEHPDALLYCFRGGKRSQIAVEWLREVGTPIERIEGGYKHLRNYLLGVIQKPPKIVLLSGTTGVGKTELLPFLENTADLEGLANHRGSAFGKQLTPQPSQIDFENQLAIEFLSHPDYVVLEDESRLIGRIHLPPNIQAAMQSAPIVLLEDSLENRVTRIREEYVMQPLLNENSQSLVQLEERLQESLQAIQRRLGGDRYQELKTNMGEAFLAHSKGDASAHELWIEILLRDYYDPMYEYQLKKKQDRIRKRINWADIPESGGLDFRAYAS